MPQKTPIQKDLDVLNMMVFFINRYFNKSIHISDLIYDLESYLNQLILVDTEWKKNFRTIWLDIEISYALALDQKLNQFDKEKENIVTDALHILKQMAQNKMEEIQRYECSPPPL